MKQRVIEARVLLLVMGLLQLALSLTFGYALLPTSLDAGTVGRLAIFTSVDCALGLGMLFAARTAGRHPLRTLRYVFIAWVAVQVLLAALARITPVQGILVKVVLVFVLLRGYRAARQAEAIRTQLALGPSKGESPS